MLLSRPTGRVIVAGVALQLFPTPRVGDRGRGEQGEVAKSELAADVTVGPRGPADGGVECR